MKIPDAGKLMRCCLPMVFCTAFTVGLTFSQELKIEQSEIVQDPNITPEDWEKTGEDLFGASFQGRPDFLVRANESESDVVDDPFGHSPQRTTKVVTAQQALEKVGVPFADGGSATFDGSTVTVPNSRANMQLLDIYFGRIYDPPQLIAVRTEI